MNDKYCRICWNSSGWRKPTGNANESGRTYTNVYGFGHEEWLFSFDHLIDDHYYAFLQPINKYFDKYQGNQININLYTIRRWYGRYWVAIIKDVEILTRDESKEIYDLYKKNGWLDERIKDVENVGGDPTHLITPFDPALSIFNIKFKKSKIEFLKEPNGAIIEIERSHKLSRDHNYYHPYDWFEDD